MPRLSKKQRDLYADTMLAATDAVITLRPGWRGLSPLLVAAEALGISVDRLRQLAAPIGKALHVQREAEGGPLHYPNGSTHPEAYDGYVSIGLEVAARIREARQ